MIIESHSEDGYCIVRYPEERWAEIDTSCMAFKYWEGPIDEVDAVLPEVLQ